MLEFIEELKRRGIENATVSQTGCVGVCRLEPIVEVYVKGQEKVTYVHMTPEKVARVVNDHIVNGRPVGRIHRRRAGISRSVRGGASYGSDSLACDGLRRHELFV